MTGLDGVYPASALPSGRLPFAPGTLAHWFRAARSQHLWLPYLPLGTEWAPWSPSVTLSQDPALLPLFIIPPGAETAALLSCYWFLLCAWALDIPENGDVPNHTYAHLEEVFNFVKVNEV